MSFKPIRSFAASEGDYSVDDKGPEALKADLDQLMKMFDPTSVHDNGEPGGIHLENLGFSFGDSTMMSAIGGLFEGTEMTLQQIVDVLAERIYNKYSVTDAQEYITQKTDPLIKKVEYNDSARSISVTTSDGSVTTVADFSMYIRKDGTKLTDFITEEQIEEEITKLLNVKVGVIEAKVEDISNLLDSKVNTLKKQIEDNSSFGLMSSELDDYDIRIGSFTNAGSGWNTYTFERPFKGVPKVVLQVAHSDNYFVTVNNVSETGFQYRVQKFTPGSLTTAGATGTTTVYSASGASANSIHSAVTVVNSVTHPVYSSGALSNVSEGITINYIAVDFGGELTW